MSTRNIGGIISAGASDGIRTRPTSVEYLVVAGGGGGGGYTGGGGAGKTAANVAAVAGTVNLGGGGGGGGENSSSGAAGGKGVVILRVASNVAVATVTNASISSITGYLVYTFNDSGTIKWGL